MIYERLKDIREYFAKTQKEMASVHGVRRSTYAGWGNWVNTIPLLRLNDYCNYLDISLVYICGLSKDKIKNLA